MSAFQASIAPLTISALLATTACQAEPSASDDCDSTLAADDPTCLGATADADGDGDGDEPPSCGNGVVEGDEECDDANTIDSDECSNSCNFAACGDGIVQEWNGETCDDGNPESGDTCTTACVLPGTTMWSRLIEGDSCYRVAVALADNGNIHVVSDCDGGRGVRVLDEDGDPLWSSPTPLSTAGAPNIAVTAENDTVLGGQFGNLGDVRVYDAAGNYRWSAIVPLAMSRFLDVTAVESGSIVAVGNGDTKPIMFQYSADGELEWSHVELGAEVIWRVASSPAGMIAALQEHKVAGFTAAGEAAWTSATLLAEKLRDLAVDHEDNTYVVGWSDSVPESFVVTKLGPDGSIEWNELHDQPNVFESAEAIAALPSGGVLVAGWTNHDGFNAECDGLLSWYSSDGTLLGDATFDGADNNDPDVLLDVAVSPDGYAVAVGYHKLPNNGDRQLWILKVAI